MNLIDQIERDESFRAKPYQCSEGVWTFGHGFTSITLDESRVVLEMKVNKLRPALNQTIKSLSPARQDVILNMAYNLGVTGLFNFKLIWNAIYRGDFDRAAEEMLDSRWAKQVKGRAVRLAEIMRKG